MQSTSTMVQGGKEGSRETGGAARERETRRREKRAIEKTERKSSRSRRHSLPRPQPRRRRPSLSPSLLFHSPAPAPSAMLRRPDARAGGISVTFTTARASKSGRRAPGSKSAAAEERDAELPKASEAALARGCEPTTESASPPPRSSSSSPSSSSLFGSAASSIGVYAGFYWWILVITAGIAPTLWSSMALCWHLGDCPAAWLCLALSGLYWVRFFFFLFLFSLSLS